MTLDLDGQIIKHSNELKKISEIIIINSFGEMTKYFSFCNSIFMGKSLSKNWRKLEVKIQLNQLSVVVKYITVPISQILKKYIVC